MQFFVSHNYSINMGTIGAEAVAQRSTVRIQVLATFNIER